MRETYAPEANAPINCGLTHNGRGAGTLRVGSITRDRTDAASPQVIGASGQAMSGLQPFSVVKRCSYDKCARYFHFPGLFVLKRVDPLHAKIYSLLF